MKGGPVAGDPILAEPLKYGADILVLELDRFSRPIDLPLHLPVMFGLAVNAAGNVVGPSIAKYSATIRSFSSSVQGAFGI